MEQDLCEGSQKGIEKAAGSSPEHRRRITPSVQDPFAPELETHKLRGKLSGSWAYSAGYDLRIVFDFVKDKKRKEDDIFLMEIGTHDEVY